MNKEFMEAFLMSKQGGELKVNIFSCRGGEGFKSCQIIENAVITKQEYGVGLEIKDRERPEAIIKIGYSKLKKIRIMGLDDLILTFIYRTICIEVIIKEDVVTGVSGLNPINPIEFK